MDVNVFHKLRGDTLNSLPKHFRIDCAISGSKAGFTALFFFERQRKCFNFLNRIKFTTQLTFTVNLTILTEAPNITALGIDIFKSV